MPHYRQSTRDIPALIAASDVQIAAMETVYLPR
jgi:hypothetical protein